MSHEAVDFFLRSHIKIKTPCLSQERKDKGGVPGEWRSRPSWPIDPLQAAALSACQAERPELWYGQQHEQRSHQRHVFQEVNHVGLLHLRVGHRPEVVDGEGGAEHEDDQQNDPDPRADTEQRTGASEQQQNTTTLKYSFLPVKKRLVPGEEHPQNIRECAIPGEMLRVGIGPPLVPGSHFLLEDVPNRRFVRLALATEDRREKPHG